MFIRKAQYSKIIKRLEKLERQNAKHAEFLHNDYETLGQYEKHIEEIEKTVGKNNPNIYDSALLGLFSYENHPYYRQAKKLTLIEKVEQIMDHLGLVVKHTQASVKLAKKPEPKLRETKKKGKN